MQSTRWRLLVIFATAATASAAVNSQTAIAAAPYPASKIETVTDTLHGATLSDPYRWLEDQQSPATRAWIEAQNAYTEKILSAYPGGKQIAGRLAELLKVDSVSLPVARGNRYFFTKQFADRDLPVVCLRQGLEGKDDVLIDPASLSKDGSKTVSLLDVSRDGKLLVYGVRTAGEDEVAVRFFDVEKRADRPKQLPRARYFGVSLTPDQQTLFYARHESAGSRVFRRPIATAADEKQIFGEGYDAGVGISPALSEDGRWLIIQVWYGSAAKKTEIFAQDLSQPGSPIVPIVKDIEARFAGDAVDHRLFVETNWKAPNGRILQIDLTKPAPANWQEIVPENQRATLEGFSLVGGRIYANYLENVASRLRVFDIEGRRLREVQFGSLGSIGRVAGEWSGSESFLTFGSFHVPSTIYREDAASGAQSVWFRPRVPVDSDKFEVKQVTYPSKDGTKVPMFLVHKKGLALDGNRPTLLNGYGGFNISLTPAFASRAVVWIENGGVYAVANLRGGGEFGEKWHEAGMGERKQNVFEDFIAAAEWLVKEKFTRPEKLAIAGRSNGGLLVGAALTQRPDLFGAVICGYPLLDMVRYHQFLVARFWVPEYGSSEDARQFQTLRAYSPYHRVQAGTKYPAVLFVTGDADTRVDPLHARKMTALLQASTGSDRPVLLKYDTRLGHTGAQPVSKTIDDIADEFAFLFEQLGVKSSEAAAAIDNPKSKIENPPTDAAAQKFRALLDAEWQYGLREEPAFASHLGDRRYNDRWPDVSLAAFARRQAHKLEVLKQLDAIDSQKLSPEDQLNYRLFRREYDLEIESYPYLGHLLPVNQRDGIQDAASIADELSFARVKDYDDWLARLNTFPAYMEQTIELMREGIKQRVMQPKVVMQRVPAQIRGQIVQKPEESQFFGPFKQFPDEIPQAERDRLIAAAKRAIAERVVPAYQVFAGFFEQEYLPACYDSVGAWQHPNSPEYYAFRARQFTTTTHSPKQIHELGLREIARIRGEMEAIVRQVKFQGSFREFLEHLRTAPEFYYKDPHDLLVGYQALCKQIDPQLPKLFRRLPRIPYGVEAIPANMAPDTTTAYYRQPSADGSRAGTFFVNLYKPEARPKYEMEALTLHESVPGHHLQIALASELEGLPNFRRYGGFTSYIEGWGLYAEGLGGELGLYRDPYSKFGQLTYEMWRAVRLVVDTGMHAFQWPRERAIELFKENTAKTDIDIVNEVDRYISWPGQALAYKIGELKIRELRKRAADTLGDRFDVREFHDVVLRQGAVPLDVLEELVNAWIGETAAQ